MLKRKVNNLVFALLIIVLIVTLVVVGPLLTIWALNTLFGLGIETTLATWFATWWLLVALKANNLVKKSE
jgi:hypothetical protein